VDKISNEKIEEISVKKYLDQNEKEVSSLDDVFENLKPRNSDIKKEIIYIESLKNIFEKNKDSFSNNEDLFKFISNNFDKEDIAKNFELLEELDDNDEKTILGFNKTSALFDVLREEDFSEIKKSFKEYFIKEHMDMKNKKIKPSKYW